VNNIIVVASLNSLIYLNLYDNLICMGEGENNK